MERDQPIPRVLLLGPDFTTGGGGTHFKNMSEPLFDGRADILLLRPGRTDVVHRGSRLVDSLNCKSDLDYPRVLRELRNRIRTGRYDVVLGFGPYPNLAVWCATRGLPDRPRTVLCEINRPTTATSEASFLWRPQTLLKNWLTPRAYGNADVVAANSMDGVEECIRLYGVDRRRAVRIPNLISESQLRERAQKPLPTEWPRQKHVLVVSCRLVRQKRVDTIIEALALLDPALDAALVVIGDGDKRAELEQMALAHGVADRVRFVGWQDDPMPFVGRASAAVIASEYEGFSNSVIEAMFLDVPNITSFSTSDTRDMVAQRAALGFEVGDAKGLAEAVTRLFASPELRAEIVRKAAAYRAPFEMTEAIRFYERLLTTTANRGGLEPLTAQAANVTP